MLVVLSRKLLAFVASKTFGFFTFLGSPVVRVTTSLGVMIFVTLLDSNDGERVMSFTCVSLATIMSVVTSG